MRFWEFSNLLINEDDRSKIEKDQIDFINSQIQRLKGSKPFINLKVGSKDPIPAAAAVKTPGTNKSDCSIVDTKGNPLAYISLKGDSHFWGRWLRLMKWYSKPENISKNPKFDEFLQNVKNITRGTLLPKESFHMNIVSEFVQQQIMYGTDFGKQSSVNNVDVILKGKPEILKTAEFYVLSATRVYKNGDIPEQFEAPRLVIHYVSKGKRGGLNNANIDTERAGSLRNSLPLNNKEEVVAAQKEIQRRRAVNKPQQDITNVSSQRSQSNLSPAS